VIPGVRMRSPATLGGVRGELLELSPLRGGCGGGKVRRGRCHLGGINFPSRLSSEGRGPGRADRSPDRPDPPALCSIPGWSGPWRLRGLTSPRPVSLRRLWVWFPARDNQRREKVRPSNNGRPTDRRPFPPEARVISLQGVLAPKRHHHIPIPGLIDVARTKPSRRSPQINSKLFTG